MSLDTLPMADLRALIDRQLAAQAKARDDIRELDGLLRESLAEFMRRVAPAPAALPDAQGGAPVAPHGNWPPDAKWSDAAPGTEAACPACGSTKGFAESRGVRMCRDCADTSTSTGRLLGQGAT